MAQAGPVAVLETDPVNRGGFPNTLITAYIAYDPSTGDPILVRTGGVGGPQVTVLRTPEALLARFGEETLRIFKQVLRGNPSGHPVEVLETALLTARMALEGEFGE